ncbi:MAG TPA: glycosyl hydrolase family 28-related protein [Rariglobus sp.]
MKRLFFRAGLPCALLLQAGCTGSLAPDSFEDTPSRSYSKLWGRDGELWLRAGRLPDFSFAGYRSGERPVPDYPVAASVATYGAKGDDDVDDTAAFQAALAATKSGAIQIPPGRYIISGVLRIIRPGVVLRGSGVDRTTLFFPKPLEDIEPDSGETTSGQPTSNYSWSGGFVRLQGSLGGKVLTAITARARRGDQSIEVGQADSLTAGQYVEIFQADTANNSLALHLYSDDADDVSNLKGKTTASLVSKIIRIEGKRVELERDLRFDLRPEWRPVVRSFAPTVQDSGVEDLTFEFPPIPYAGHFTEKGFNPVAFAGVANCWARRLKFVNPDSGPMVGGAFNTVSDVVFESNREPDKNGQQGHHGIYLQSLGDHLFTRFDIRLRFVHDITVSKCAGVVVSQGKGVDLCFDQHKRAPYETLFTSIDLGRGTRPWKSGGGQLLGKNGGARTTFWNLQAAGPLPEPPKNYAPWSLNLVGVDLGRPQVLDPAGVWREVVPAGALYPPDLHASQLSRRLSER